MEFEIMGQPVVAWQLFAALGIAFVFLEAFAPGFILLPIGVAALITSPMTVVTSSWISQLAIFGVNLIVVFLVMKKFFKPIKAQGYKSNADSMIGKIAIVVEPISASHPGYVKLYGDRWQALTHSQQTLAIDESVVIDKVDGNKVFVRKEE